MSALAIIHAGPAAPGLKKLLATLDTVGVREDYFMSDLVSTLRYEEDFNDDLNAFLYELIFGEFYHYQMARCNVEKINVSASQILDDIAVLSKQVLKYLHETLLSRGLYAEGGKFPYEYNSFDGRVISLRCL